MRQELQCKRAVWPIVSLHEYDAAHVSKLIRQTQLYILQFAESKDDEEAEKKAAS